MRGAESHTSARHYVHNWNHTDEIDETHLSHHACCRSLHCVVCCSMLQCVAVRCSMRQIRLVCLIMQMRMMRRI